MPTSEQLLAHASTIAQSLLPLAIAWHVFIALLLFAFVRGWDPRERVIALLLAAPAASVAAAAAAFGNPFNAISFGMLAMLLATFARHGRVTAATPWARAVGAGLLAFAWVYPHFLPDASLLYLVAAPVGLVPCPTLALLAAFTLLAGGFGARAIPITVGIWCAVYADIGIARLGVWLDVGLAIAALATLSSAIVAKPALQPAT